MSGINQPKFMPGISELEMRRDFIWYCREHAWPEEIQDQVLRIGIPSVENAAALIRVHGPRAIDRIVEMGETCR